jgi:hypothetical protein
VRNRIEQIHLTDRHQTGFVVRTDNDRCIAFAATFAEKVVVKAPELFVTVTVLVSEGVNVDTTAVFVGVSISYATVPVGAVVSAVHGALWAGNGERGAGSGERRNLTPDL